MSSVTPKSGGRPTRHRGHGDVIAASLGFLEDMVVELFANHGAFRVGRCNLELAEVCRANRELLPLDNPSNNLQ